MNDEPVRRRDWLVTAAFTMAGVGGLFALWPFVAALGPAADTMARRVTFNTTGLIGTKQATIDVEGRPIAIFRRTETELSWLRYPSMPNKTRDPSSFTGEAFRDRDSHEPRQPSWAKNWHRSLHAGIVVLEAMCTREGCVVSRQQSFRSNTNLEDVIACPCCGSRYDLAGRAFAGPAKYNLRVPPHRFVDATTIEFTASEVLSTTASPANPS
ncbi:MAG: ubiquinol-cytochrome c reductase iron-sulfur subunit [Micropepsaceae bacterium]